MIWRVLGWEAGQPATQNLLKPPRVYWSLQEPLLEPPRDSQSLQEPPRVRPQTQSTEVTYLGYFPGIIFP